MSRTIMRHVKFEISVSLDGFVTAAGMRLDEATGDGGEQLHEWAFGAHARWSIVLAESKGSTRASICGRRPYDTSIESRGADGFGFDLRTPTFIVSHTRRDLTPMMACTPLCRARLMRSLPRRRLLVTVT